MQIHPSTTKLWSKHFFTKGKTANGDQAIRELLTSGPFVLTGLTEITLPTRGVTLVLSSEC